MQITCYSGFSKELNSTKQPTGGTSVNVTLKEPTSVINPIFIISGYNLAWNYIQWGARYYYVDDVVIVHNNVAEYHCSSDPMATFKSDITSSSQFVTRSATTNDPLMIDSAYPTKAGATVDTENFTMTQGTSSSGTYVIGVINEKAHGGVAYYSFGANGTGFSSFLSYMFSDAWLSDDPDISVEIQKELINPFQYVVSCVWYPFSVAGDLDDLYFGYWDSGLDAGLISESDRQYLLHGSLSLPRHPQATANGAYMNGAPFTRYLLDCYTFGQIPLDPAPFVSSPSVNIDVIVDLFAGNAELRITNSTGTFEHRYNSNFGVDIQLSQVNQKMIQSSLGAIAGAGGGAAVGAALGPLGAVAGGVLGLASGVASSLNNVFPQVQTAGSMGSKNAYIRTPFVESQFYSTPTIAPALIGRPLMQQRSLSGLSGFTVCEHVDLDTTASPQEKRQIVDYMTTGFFIE